ncbi:MAG: hypothetical protein ACOH1T_07555 [Microbacteriaceae bacterium]
MAVTELHPSVITLSQGYAVLIDPTVRASSEFSAETLQRLMAQRHRLYIRGAVLGLVGLGVSVLLRMFVLPQVPVVKELPDTVGYLISMALVMAGAYPFMSRAYAIDKQLTTVARGGHVLLLSDLNQSGLDASDATPAHDLWEIGVLLRSVDEATKKVDNLFDGNPQALAAMRRRLLVRAKALEEKVHSAGLTMDLAPYLKDGNV